MIQLVIYDFYDVLGAIKSVTMGFILSLTRFVENCNIYIFTKFTIKIPI